MVFPMRLQLALPLIVGGILVLAILARGAVVSRRERGLGPRTGAR